MESGLELEYAFDTEDGADGGFAAGGAETSGNRTAGNSGQQGNNGLPEGFVTGDGGGPESRRQQTGQECRKCLCREEPGKQRQW